MRLRVQLALLVLALASLADSQYIRQLTNTRPPTSPTSDSMSTFLRQMQERAKASPQFTQRLVQQPPALPTALPTIPAETTERPVARFGSNLDHFHQQQRQLQERLAQHQATLDEQRLQREQQEREREQQQRQALHSHQLMLDAHRRQMDDQQRVNEQHTQNIFAEQQGAYVEQQKQLQEQLQAQRDTQKGLEKAQMAIDMDNGHGDETAGRSIGRMMDDGKVSAEQAERDAETRRVDAERLQTEQEQRQQEKEQETEREAKWSQHQAELEERLKTQQSQLEEQQAAREQAAREREEQHRSDLEEQRLAVEAHRLEQDAKLAERDRQAQEDFQTRQDALMQRLKEQEEQLRAQESTQREQEQRDKPLPSEGRMLLPKSPADEAVSEEPCGETAHCQNSGSCQLSHNATHVCVCERPWVGVRCESTWQNPCTEAQLRASDISQFKDPWNANNYIICTDINVYHSLPCAPGTFFNELYGACMKRGHNPRVCPLNHCRNEAACVTTDANEFVCECRRGFSGQFCETNIDECAGHKACGDKGRCVDQLNGFYCQCGNDTIGLSCANETISNPCTSDALVARRELFSVPDSGEGRAYLHCTGELSFVLSRCPEGLFWHQEDLACTLERPTVKSGKCMEYPCENGAECRDLDGTEFECVCKAGYKGPLCETMVDSCASSPCQNGGRCLAFPGGYTCACPDKVVDDCCCHGIKNPCPQTAMIIPGLNNYYAHPLSDRYIHCDFDGRAFARKCSEGLSWSQRSLSCLPRSFVEVNVMAVKSKQVDLPSPTPELTTPTTTSATEATTDPSTTTELTTTAELTLTSSETAEIEKKLDERRDALMQRIHTKNLRFARPVYRIQ